MGQFDFETLSQFVQTYRLYLRQLEAYHESNLQAIRTFNRVNDDEKNDSDNDSGETGSSEELELLSEIQTIKPLLTDARRLKKRIVQSVSFSFNIEELAHFDDEVSGKETDDSFDLNPGSPVLEKATIVLDIIKSIPLLHPLGLVITKKIKNHAPWQGIAQLYERRIQMKMLQSYIRRVEAGDISPQQKMVSTFKKILSVYRKIKAVIKKRGVKTDDHFFLLEYADVIFAGCIYRNLLELPDIEALKLLEEGKQTLNMAVTDSPEFTKKNRRLQKASNFLEAQIVQ